MFNVPRSMSVRIQFIRNGTECEHEDDRNFWQNASAKCVRHLISLNYYSFNAFYFVHSAASAYPAAQHQNVGIARAFEVARALIAAFRILANGRKFRTCTVHTETGQTDESIQ